MRIQDLLSEERAKVPPKPRNPVARAAQKVAKGSGGHTNPKNTIPRKEKHKKDMATMESVTERVRDPEDWDEGNTEPPNNFAVYINGKKWKVFQGRGQYADDAREKAHYQQMKDWAASKSATTGKKWEIAITGEPATK